MPPGKGQRAAHPCVPTRQPLPSCFALAPTPLARPNPRRAPRAAAPFGSPLEVLEALTPVMCAATLLMSLATEQLWEVLPGSPYFAGGEEALATAGLVFLGAVIAFLMVWAEFEVRTAGERWGSCRGAR